MRRLLIFQVVVALLNLLAAGLAWRKGNQDGAVVGLVIGLVMLLSAAGTAAWTRKGK